MTGVAWRSREKARLKPMPEMRSSRMPAPSICGADWPAPLSHPLHLGHVFLNKMRSCLDIDSCLPAMYIRSASSPASFICRGACGCRCCFSDCSTEYSHPLASFTRLGRRGCQTRKQLNRATRRCIMHTFCTHPARDFRSSLPSSGRRDA